MLESLHLKETVEQILPFSKTAKPRVAIQPLLFDVTAGVPTPHPPCNQPTPDASFEMHVRDLKAVIEDRRRRNAEEVAIPSSTFWGTAAVLTRNAIRSVENTSQEVQLLAEAKLRETLRKKWQKDYETIFRTFESDDREATTPGMQSSGGTQRSDVAQTYQYLASETVQTVYTCEVIHAGIPQQVDAYFTGHSIVLVNAQVFGVIAFRDIISIQRSLALPLAPQLPRSSGSSPLAPMYFIPVPVADVRHTAIQIYTAHGQLYQLYNFESLKDTTAKAFTSYVHGRVIDRVYIWMDHIWRRAVHCVPQPGYTYVEYQN